MARSGSSGSNRPEVFNATNHDLHEALAAIWPELDRDLDARAAVLTGNGKAFSAGGDFTYLDDLVNDTELRRVTLNSGRAIVSA